MGLEAGVGVCAFLSPLMCVSVHLCVVQILVSNAEGTPITIRGRRRRESNYVHCAKHKSTLVGCITTASYLASLCLPFFLNSQHHCRTYTCIRFPPSPLWPSLPAPLSPQIISCLLFASQPSCLAACAIQAYWAEERQFGSTQLPADRCYSSHCHSLRDFLLTRRAC